MAQFFIKPDSVRQIASEEGRMTRELSRYESEIRSIANSLGFKVAAASNIRNRLNSTAGKMDRCRWSMNEMQSALNNIVDTYSRTENNILENLHVDGIEIKNSSGKNYERGSQPEWMKTIKSKTDPSFLMKLVGKAGPAGAIINTIYKFVTSDKPPLAKWADAVSDIWKDVWKVADTVKKCKKTPEVKWWKEALGLNPSRALKGLKNADLSRTVKAMHGWNSKIKGTLREFKKVGGCVKQVGGIVFSAFTNLFDNFEEQRTDGISTERVIKETVMETTVDWCKDLLIGAGVTAAAAAMGIAAPALAVGAVSVAISAGADWACKKFFDKKLTETISDTFLDGAEWLLKNVTTGAKKVQKGITSLWNSVARGWKAAYT